MVTSNSGDQSTLVTLNKGDQSAPVTLINELLLMQLTCDWEDPGNLLDEYFNSQTVLVIFQDYMKNTRPFTWKKIYLFSHLSINIKVI